MSTRRGAVLVLLFVLGALSACGETGNAVGARCEQDADCFSGLCDSSGAAGFCTVACDDAADCPADLRCGVEPGSGERRCAMPCDVSYEPGYVCIDQALVACEDAGAAWNCGDCGCPDDEYCDAPATACVPDLAVGQPCFDHDACASNNCSATDWATAGFCQVAEGAPCTDDNCASCDRRPTGTSCAQTCSGGGVCDSDQECIGHRDTDEYFCRAECDPGDPDTCAYGWRCQNVELFTETRWLCSPSPTCEPGVTGCRDSDTCQPLAGTTYAICAPGCSPFGGVCPPHWSCQRTADSYACLPTPP